MQVRQQVQPVVQGKGSQKTSTRAAIVNHVEISKQALEKQIEDLQKRIESIEKEIAALAKKAGTKTI